MSKFDQIAAEAPALEASVDAVLNALRNPESSGLRAEQLQALLSHAVTAYAKLRETNDGLPAFPRDNDVSATAVAIAATGILDAAEAQMPGLLAAVAATSPLNRLADPAETAAAIAFLASDECPFMTGAEMLVDGGAMSIHPGF